jgi:hypothetical protein
LPYFFKDFATQIPVLSSEGSFLPFRLLNVYFFSIHKNFQSVNINVFELWKLTFDRVNWGFYMWAELSRLLTFCELSLPCLQVLYINNVLTETLDFTMCNKLTSNTAYMLSQLFVNLVKWLKKVNWLTTHCILGNKKNQRKSHSNSNLFVVIQNCIKNGSESCLSAKKKSLILFFDKVVPIHISAFFISDNIAAYEFDFVFIFFFIA